MLFIIMLNGIMLNVMALAYCATAVIYSCKNVLNIGPTCQCYIQIFIVDVKY
jgi:hypothetical protein